MCAVGFTSLSVCFFSSIDLYCLYEFIFFFLDPLLSTQFSSFVSSGRQGYPVQPLSEYVVFGNYSVHHKDGLTCFGGTN